MPRYEYTVETFCPFRGRIANVRKRQRNAAARALYAQTYEAIKSASGLDTVWGNACAAAAKAYNDHTHMQNVTLLIPHSGVRVVVTARPTA